MAKDLQVHRNYGLHYRILLVGILGTGCSAYLYYSQLYSASPSLVWMVLLTISGFSFFFLFANSIKRILVRKPALELLDSGLIDQISIAKVGMIPWKNIKSVKYEEYLNREHILIAIDKSQEIIEKLPVIRKKMVNQQFVDTGAVIVIDPKMINAKPEELVASIKKRLKRYW